MIATTEHSQYRSNWSDLLPPFGDGNSLATNFQLDSYEGDINEPRHMHKYLYAGHDPVNNVDPAGLDFSLGGIMANIGTGIRMAGMTLNAVHRVYSVVGTIQNAITIFNFVTKLNTFINVFTLGMKNGAAFGPALSNAVNSAFGVSLPSLSSFAPGIQGAFDYVGNRWTDLRNRIVRNAGRLANEVAADLGLQQTIASQAIKMEPVGLLLNLPSPPAGTQWKTITTPPITLPGGFRIKVQSDGRRGRLFGIGAFISGKSRDHNINFIHIDYQKIHSGIGRYAPHANIGPGGNNHVDI